MRQSVNEKRKCSRRVGIITVVTDIQDVLVMRGIILQFRFMNGPRAIFRLFLVTADGAPGDNPFVSFLKKPPRPEIIGLTFTDLLVAFSHHDDPLVEFVGSLVEVL